MTINNKQRNQEKIINLKLKGGKLNKIRKYCVVKEYMFITRYYQ